MSDVSLFNDVLGPVMRGPSSSHTAAAQRIGCLIRHIVDGVPIRATIDYPRGSSLETTHRTQGSDMGLAAGLLGWEMTDPRVPRAVELAEKHGLELEFGVVDYEHEHPNTYRVHVNGGDGRARTVIALSTGGGMIEITRIDDFFLSIRGNFHEYLRWSDPNESQQERERIERLLSSTVDVELLEGTEKNLIHLRSEFPLPEVETFFHLPPVLPVLGNRRVSESLRSLHHLKKELDLSRTAASEIALTYECERSGKPRGEVHRMAEEILQVMRRSVDGGMRETDYSDRLLSYPASEILERTKENRLLPGDLLNRCLAYITAVLGAKSAMEVVVASPTAGSCGVVPGTLIAAGESLSLEDATIADGLLAAGLTGTYILERATFAGEVAGCQAECGVAGAMAAAGLMEMMNESAEQAFAAASFALQNMLGLICDPIANRVEAPCLGKNVTAGCAAIASVNLILSGTPPLIPLEETAEAMLAVGKMLPRELRCTALGGLAITSTAKEIERKLHQNRT